MKKRTIGVLYSLSIVLVIVALFYFFPFLANAMHIQFMHTYRLSTPALTISSVSLVLAWILGMIAWIGTLVNLARAQLWTWFTLTFFFGGIMMFLYLIAGPQPLKAGLYPLPHQSQGYPLSNVPLGVPQPLSSLEILQQRYARGEIDTATFAQMRGQMEMSHPQMRQ